MEGMYRYSIGELEGLAKEMAQEARAPYSFLLDGPIGVGKTTFSKFFIKSLQEDTKQNVTSPTFNIVQIYDSVKGPIWHVDLYRLKNESELFQLGLLEAMHECICLIEWPGILEKFISDCNYRVIDLAPQVA